MFETQSWQSPAKFWQALPTKDSDLNCAGLWKTNEAETKKRNMRNNSFLGKRFYKGNDSSGGYKVKMYKEDGTYVRDGIVWGYGWSTTEENKNKVELYVKPSLHFPNTSHTTRDYEKVQSWVKTAYLVPYPLPTPTPTQTPTPEKTPTPTDTPTPTKTPQPAPYDFTLTSATDETLTFAWKLASSNQEKVKIQISDDDKFSNIVDENTILEEDNRTTETFSGLTNSKKYYARICAFLGDSNEQSAFTLANGSTTVPGRLLIVTKSITDLGKKPKLAWSPVSAEYDGVEVYRLIASSNSFAKIMTVNKSDGNTFTDTSVTEDGTYEYKLRIINNDSKFGGTYSDVFKISLDTNAPNIPTLSVEATKTKDNTPTWSWNTNSDAAKYHVILNRTAPDQTKVYESESVTNSSYTHNVALVDGMYELKIASIDLDGNKSEFASKVIIVDTKAPNVPTLSVVSSPTNNKKPTWTWNSNSDVVNYGIVFNNGSEQMTTNLSFTPANELTDGTYTIKVRAYDDVGNVSEFATNTVVVDASAPALVTRYATSPVNTKKPTWTWSPISDAVEYGVKLNSNVEIKQTATTFTSPIDLADGTHTLRVRSKDAVGNWSEYSSKSVVIDTTPPAKPNPSAVTPTANPRPTWTWTASEGAILYELRINNGSTFTQTQTAYQPTSDYTTGTYTLYVRAKDSVGNYSEFGSSAVEVDRTAPAKPQPVSVTPTTNKLPTWTWPAVSGATVYGVILNNSSEAFIKTNSFTAPSQLSDGDNVIKVRAQDAVGNVSDYGTHTVKVDTTPPATPIVSSDTPTTTSKRPTWKWTRISDATKYVWKLQLVSKGGQVEKIITAGTSTLNSYTPNTDLADGHYMLTVTAVDALNNESAPNSFTLLIDLTPPSLPVISAPEKSRNRKPSWSYSSSSEDIKDYGVIFNNGSEQITTSTSFTPSTDLENGKYTLKVRARDQLNNWSDTAQKDVTVYCAPASFDLISVPSSFSGGFYTYASLAIYIMEIKAGDIIGLKFDEMVDGFRTVDMQINGTYAGQMIFGGGRSANVGACVYLQRAGVCYWAKVEQTSTGVYFVNFSTNFSGECE